MAKDYFDIGELWIVGGRQKGLLPSILVSDAPVMFQAGSRGPGDFFDFDKCAWSEYGLWNTTLQEFCS